MRNFWKHKTAIFLIGATLVIAILIGIFGAVASKEVASLAENAVGVSVSPGFSASSGIGGWFRNIFLYFGSVKNLREENEALRQANVELDKKLRDVQGMEKENERLRAMLDLNEAESDLDLVAARVIAKDPSNWYSSFTINKGTKDGIEKDQPVFTGNYELVGRVYKVGSNWAEIITILDPDSGVGSLIRRTKDIGVLEGDSSLRMQGQCRLGYLSRDAEVAVGDYVETSGMGGIYPKGLLIGKVTEVMEDNETMSKYAAVEPLADIDRLTEVFVLKNFTEEIDAVLPEDDGKSKDSKKSEKDYDEDEDSGDYDNEDEREESSGTTEPSSDRTSGRNTGRESEQTSSRTESNSAQRTSNGETESSRTESSTQGREESETTDSEEDSAAIDGVNEMELME